MGCAESRTQSLPERTTQNPEPKPETTYPVEVNSTEQTLKSLEDNWKKLKEKVNTSI